MPQYRRARVQGGTYFFTVNTLYRRPLLTDERVRATLRDGIHLARVAHPFEVIAWALLPDHLHCIWTLPPGDVDFGRRWSLIKRHVSIRCAEIAPGLGQRGASRLKRNESALWQRRFWEHQIRDDSDLAHHVDYIHWNPVKHGYVKRAADWPFSTFHRFVRAKAYPEDWGGGDIPAHEGGQYGE
jgi:putative transposase